MLSVHGMCTHGAEWVKRIGEEFARFLGLTPGAPVKLDYVEGIEIWRTTLSDGNGRPVVRDYALVWSPLTVGAKQALCYDVSHGSPSCPEARFKRARLNSQFKSGLLDDCMADAIVYLGPTSGRQRRTPCETP